MFPPAPLRFRMMIGWPSSLLISLPMMRATVSELPPGAKGTIIEIGPVGYSAAWTAADGRKAAASRKADEATASKRWRIRFSWIDIVGFDTPTPPANPVQHGSAGHHLSINSRTRRAAVSNRLDIGVAP